MSTWIIPYVDQDMSFWEAVTDQFGAYIKEVYFPLPVDVIGSGRGRQPDTFLEEFLRRTSLAKSVLLNPVILPKPVEEVIPVVLDALKRLCESYDVRSATVTNLTLAKRIRETLPALKIVASVLMGISRPAQALVVRDYVDALTPDNSLVRDLKGLGRLRQAFAGEIRLLVNEACIPGCLHRVQHFYEMGYGASYPQSLCQQMLEEHPWLRLTGAWILPRHLTYYEGLYDTLKLAGRVTLRDRDKYFAVLNAYVHRKDMLPKDIGGGPASILEPVDISDALFEMILHCDKNCHACRACQNYYEQAIEANGLQIHKEVLDGKEG